MSEIPFLSGTGRIPVFLCCFAFLVIPNSSLAPWKHCWGCGAWAAQPLLDPRVDPGLGTGKQKGFCAAFHGPEAPVAPSPLEQPLLGAGGRGVSAPSPGQVLEVFPVVPVASGCRSRGF